MVELLEISCKQPTLQSHSNQTTSTLPHSQIPSRFTMFNVATIVTALAAFAYALPAPESLPEGFQPITRDEILKRLAEPADSLQKRTVGGILLCTGTGWTGTCGYKVQPVCHTGQCQTASEIAAHCVTLSSPYLRNIGSFGPDSGATVYISTNGDCNEASGSISSPGSDNFFNYEGGLGSQITTFLVEAN
ncbi:hypothetical protein K432DRAFT_396845 [Lepidopterella palustris CBS 459.81]|uniref:Uncharacterized protein n=1 Tax=Lepidopterella palustris CBS 459.81 TaxID=1314670 RepID=A0A8E2E2G7_9PEZI|nr:hypothetical protein K432DRAFT_396845 [Lepidopterella palustris CBS 459.81]